MLSVLVASSNNLIFRTGLVVSVLVPGLSGPYLYGEACGLGN